MITENEFPLLEWTGYPAGKTPETLPIALFNQRGADFVSKSTAFQSLLTLFDTDRYQGANLEEKIKDRILRPEGFFPNRNIYLTRGVAERFDHDDFLRNTLWKAIKNLPNLSGTVLAKLKEDTSSGMVTGVQYTFRILSPEDSKVLHQIGNMPKENFIPDHRLFMVAAFLGDCLQAFEYGYLAKDGKLHVAHEHSYSVVNHDIGMYLSYAGIALAGWMKNVFPTKELKPGEGINQTRQPVSVLSLR